MSFKIGIFGAIGVDDIGDVVMLESSLEKIKKAFDANNKKVIFYIFSLDQGKAKKQVSNIDIDFKIVKTIDFEGLNSEVLNESFEDLKSNNLDYYKRIDNEFIDYFQKCDKIFFIGGGYFNKYWGNRLVPKFIIPLSLCYILKKEYFVSGVTIGPFDDEQLKKYEGCFKNARHIFLRDGDRSMDCLDQLGSSEGVIHYSGDDVLNRWFDQDVYDKEKKEPEVNSYAVLQLHHWAEMYSSNYVRLYKELASFLDIIIAQGNIEKVYFLPFDYFKGLDYECGRRLSTFFENRSEYVVLDPTSNHVFMRKIISGAKFVLASRYHPIVFSLGEGVPALGLYVNELYEKKIGGAFQSIGVSYEPHSLFIDNITSGELYAWYEKYVRDEAFPDVNETKIKSYGQEWDKAVKNFLGLI